MLVSTHTQFTPPTIPDPLQNVDVIYEEKYIKRYLLH